MSIHRKLAAVQRVARLKVLASRMGQVARESFAKRGLVAEEDRGVVEERVGLVDVMPTLLDLLGVEKTGGEGRSLVGHLLGEFPGADSGEETPYFASTDEGVKLRGVISENYKLVLDLETDRVRLFDLEKDPSERHDLADQEPAARDRLRLLLDRHLERASLGAGQEAVLSEEEIEELRALGYAR